MANVIITIKSHFSESEMQCRCGCGKTVSSRLLTMLETLRIIVGFPLMVTSGARCEQHNRDEKGYPNSWHLPGDAVDIVCTNSFKRYKIIYNAIMLGFTGIGIHDKFIHLDLRPMDECRCFLYSK